MEQTNCMKLLFACLLFFSPSVIFAQTKVEDLVKEGVDLHDRGYYEEALLKYDSALIVEKNNYLATYEKTYTLMHLKRYNDVIDLCRLLLKEHKNKKTLGEVYVVYGNALDMTGKHKEAITVYDDGISVFPETHMLHFNKAVTLVGLKEYDKAIHSLKQVVTIYPFHPSSHYQLANLHFYDNKVFALMADLTFLAIEAESDRSKYSLKRVKEMLTADAKKTGENSYTVNLDINQLLGNKKRKEDNFASTEMILTLAPALNVEEKHKNETMPERLHRNLQSVVATFKERVKNENGFGWEFYVPFFIAMDNDKQLETLSHIILATEDDAANNKWLGVNKAKVDSFYKWMESYKWPRPKL